MSGAFSAYMVYIFVPRLYDIQTCIILIYNTVLHFILLCLEISSVSQMKGVSRLTAGHTLSPSEAMPALLEFELYEIAHVQVETQPQHLSVYEP